VRLNALSALAQTLHVGSQLARCNDWARSSGRVKVWPAGALNWCYGSPATG